MPSPRNPCHELRRLHEEKRTRYVTDQEYLALYSIASDRIQCLMDLATITGQREGDLLKLPNRDPERVHGRGDRIPAGQVEAPASASRKDDRDREDGNR